MMNEFSNIIMGNSEPIERKGKLFIHRIEERVNSSLEFIRTKYENYVELKLAINFIEYHLSDTIKADIAQLSKLGYYPAVETEMELDHSIKHALIGSYKSAFADLRRAIELSINFVYLISEQTDKKKAVNWIRSRHNTVAFTKAIKELIKLGRFKEIQTSHDWMKNLQNLYLDLSSYSHNKGILKGYRELNDTNFFSAGTSAPSIKYETLKSFCDFYIQTVKEIVAIQSLYNPVILVGVPFDEKFGLEGPMSGLFNEGQAELVNQLIPKSYRTHFDNLIENDKEIKSIVQYFDSLPNLTVEDLTEQAKRQDDFFKEINNKND